MSNQPYFPESERELERLVKKTDEQAVIDQAQWAGLQPGMRVIDVGCGPGVTTDCLARVVGPSGSAVGIDRSDERINHAHINHGDDHVSFVQRNFFSDLSDLGEFDFVWMRFILEYFIKEAFQLVTHVSESLKPGGILCLADLDHNCLNHYGLPERLDRTFKKIGQAQMDNNNFDPYVGRKLFSFLHDLGCRDIQVDVRIHHLVYGELSEFDRWHWWQKIELAGRRSGWTFDDYDDGFTGFEAEFKEYFSSPRRFAYTPLVIARGVKPSVA